MSEHEPATSDCAEQPAQLPSATDGLLEALNAIASDLDLPEVLARIVRAATELTGARGGALGFVGPSGELVEFVTSEDGGDLPSRLADPPPGCGVLGVPVRIRGAVFGNIYVTEKAGGGSFTAQDELMLDALATASGFVIESARAHRLSERLRRWRQASTTLVDALVPPLGLHEALAHVTRAARSVSGARATAILDSGEGSAVCADPDDATLVAAALQAVRLRLDAEPREPVQVVQAPGGGLSCLAIPLRARSASEAALVTMFDPERMPRDVEDWDVLVTFADQAGLAVDRSIAAANRQELAVITDRDRIARDLHDVVIQRLFATGLQLETIALLATSPEVRRGLDQAVSDLDATIQDIRSTIFDPRQP